MRSYISQHNSSFKMVEKCNGDYQRELANRMVSLLGCEGAMKSAREFHWHGVMKHIPSGN